MEKREPNFDKIKLLVLDVDGVLTDGSIIMHADGTESKSFSILDGHGIKMWHRAGNKTAIISGRMAQATIHRAQQLGIDYVYQDCKEKLPAYQELLKETGYNPEDTAYIGDDVMDIPIVRRAGFGVAVSNAVDELKEYAYYITARPGGSGAVREVVEYLLKHTGRWNDLMKRYLV